jgi:hypothetical protein
VVDISERGADFASRHIGKPDSAPYCYTRLPKKVTKRLLTPEDNCLAADGEATSRLLICPRFCDRVISRVDAYHAA